jgi:hypothetical protein
MKVKIEIMISKSGKHSKRFKVYVPKLEIGTFWIYFLMDNW